LCFFFASVLLFFFFFCGFVGVVFVWLFFFFGGGVGGYLGFFGHLPGLFFGGVGGWFFFFFGGRAGRLLVSTAVHRQADVTYVSAQVADTGIGIAAEHCDQIFESFFTTKPEGKGTGLGLTITRDIVKNHEGTIEVDSALGKGTTMIVNLPLPPQTRVARPAQ
jgi:hypothetical protein